MSSSSRKRCGTSRSASRAITSDLQPAKSGTFVRKSGMSRYGTACNFTVTLHPAESGTFVRKSAYCEHMMSLRSPAGTSRTYFIASDRPRS
eukprot:3828278-Prymnesium_polylepis.3